MKLLLISNSTNYKEPYLGWCQPLLEEFMQGMGKNVAFIPYAGVDVAGKVYPASYDAYTERVQNVFKQFGKKINSVHAAKDPAKVIEKADIIVVGGGNTFHLVAELHRNKLIEPIRRKVMEGTPYIGWSAGSNVACPTLCTTNDMPIVQPESFETLNLVPFQINPHYLDPHPEIDKMIKHGGETRQDRLNEYLAVNQKMTVVGLREACALWVNGNQLYLRGGKPMIVFRYDAEKGIQAEELEPNSDVSFLMR